MCLVVCGLAWFTCLLAMFLSRKFIGVEMMGVPQVSFIALICFEDLNPCFSALSALQFVNGFSFYYSDLSLMLEDHPFQMNGIGLSSFYWKNFNLCLLFFVITSLVGLMAFILQKTIFKEQ